ncbi:MAG: hypothetical protein WC569_06035, partial [Candidatus Omnitrophota bacterium]
MKCILLCVVSAILLALSFSNSNVSFFVFIAFVPFFLAIDGCSPKKAFLISCLLGFFFYLGVLYWLYHVTVIGLIVLCLYLALYFGFFGLFFLKLKTYNLQLITIPL